MSWFAKKVDFWGTRQRITVALGLTSSFLLIFMVFSISMTRAIYAQQKDVAVLSTKIEDLQASEKDLKESISSLAGTVADLRDKQNQQQGMLIGFGGLAALLQIVNTVLQIRGDKKG